MMTPMEEVLYLESYESALRLVRVSRPIDRLMARASRSPTPAESSRSGSGSNGLAASREMTATLSEYQRQVIAMATRLILERKVCGCGARYTLAEFMALPLVGFVGDLEERVELRNCSCHSTIGITHHIDGRIVLNG